MYIESQQIIYSPSDLTLYMDSPFASWMDHLSLTNPESLPSVDKADALMTVLQHKGMELENRILNDFIARELEIVQIEKTANALADTLIAMQSGADIIYQAALSNMPFKGGGDLIYPPISSK